jgi:hypothetical protein
LAGTVSSRITAARSEAAESPSELLAGSGMAEITAPLDVGILMSSGRQLWEPFENVRLPLHARAVVVEKAGHRVGLVALDLLGLASEAVGGMRQFKEQVVAAAGQVVAADDLVLTCTHTHSAPESIALTSLGHTEAFQAWVPRLARQIGAAVRSAADARRPCRLMVGSRPMSGLALNRRIKTKRGIASVRSKLPPNEVLGPEGPVDDVVRVAAFVDRSDRAAAILVSFTAHPVVEMCIKSVSPDYPGETSLEIERRHPGSVALFLQGAAGNVNPPDVSAGAARARQYGQQLAESVERVLADLVRVDDSELALRWRTINLPARSITGEPASEPLVARIGALRIGQAAFVFPPGEPFVEIALAIREAAPSRFTVVVGYAEDYIGYIPTDRAFANGGYETGPGRWSRVAAGSETIVRHEASELLVTLFP